MRLANAPHERSGMTAPIWTAPTDRPEAIALLREAVDLGVTFFDTADAYALGSNEELLLGRLRTDRIDLFQLHRIDHTAARGIAFLPYFPVAMGERARSGGPVARVAAELGATPSQTALAWLLHRAPNVIPIPGTSSPAHLAENAAALEVTLTEDQFKRPGA
ncbi:aldo/keto reductase [Streptomyces olindensis]|uniref:aldo/keto reductase n=1 Tax=Streptomyces olindensis TaxID=358823 RepID=UPI003F4D20DE